MADQILSNEEIRRYYKWSIYARPVLTYTLTAILVAVAITICALLWAGKATLNDSSALLLALVGAICPILTAVVVGKSWERRNGVNDSDAATAAVPPSPDMSNGSNSPNPLDRLRNMDLTAYIPRTADDLPAIN